MVILHIAHVEEDRCAGVSVAVPRHVLAQQQFARVGLVNLGRARLSDLPNVFQPDPSGGLQNVNAPFDRPDLVVFHEVYRPAYLRLSAQLRRRGIPYVIVPHGSLTPAARQKKWLKKKIAGLLFFEHFVRGAAALQCLSEQELRLSPGAVKFVGTNGTDLVARTEPFSGSGLRIVYIGRLEMRLKGLDLLVGAVERVRAHMEASGCTITIFGPDGRGERAELTRLIAQRGLAHLICVCPAVFGGEKDKILRTADCFIQTSRSEGMSMGLLEALGHGLPCLATQGTCIAGMLRQYNAGWTCETSADGIAAALEQAISERETLPQRSAGAIALVRAHFLWETAARDAVTAYRRLVFHSGRPDGREQVDGVCTS